MSRRSPKPTPGIETRHVRTCPARDDGRCNCAPSYRAIVRTPGGGKIQKTFPTPAAAKLWRQDALVRARTAPRDAPTLTVRQATENWLALARAGTIRTRSGQVYKPSALRGYDQALRDYIVPALGGTRLTDLRRRDVQHLVDDLVGRGMSASTVRNALMPLRALCRRALVRGDLLHNPTHGLELPAQRGRRDRVASPTEAAALIAQLPYDDRALWATAMYAGLRLGELQALCWEDVDLKRGVIRVRRSWDRQSGSVEPKSKAGVRVVPVVARLRPFLADLRDRSTGGALVFGRGDGRPVSASGFVVRADRIWARAGMQRITPHECRHTFASIAIAAGVNIKAVQTFMGHASITMTLDLYGHLLPGSEEEAAILLNDFLDGSER